MSGLRPLIKRSYREWQNHGIRFSVDLHVMNEDTFQNKHKHETKSLYYIMVYVKSCQHEVLLNLVNDID
jgi:hypothetical protein